MKTTGVQGEGIMRYVVVIMLSACFVFSACQIQSRGENQMDSEKNGRFQKQRLLMVERQILARNVEDPKVIEAMRTVPRHKFVPEELKGHAYEDGPLPIGHGQTISQPYIVAYMTEQLNLKGDEKVLEVGTGSGYQAAVLAEIVQSVYTIEIVEPLAKEAREILNQAGYKNIHTRIGDGYRGWPEEAPFDAIIVTAAPKTLPENLIDQLKTGGRMIVPVGDWAQTLLLIRKTEKDYTQEKLLPVRFVPMIHSE